MNFTPNRSGSPRRAISVRISLTIAALAALLVTPPVLADPLQDALQVRLGGDLHPVDQRVAQGPAPALGLPSDHPKMHAPADSKQPETIDDLTKLSLEELLNLEVVQINVLGSHTHLGGQWMVGYRYMTSSFSGYRDGTRELSRRDVFRKYPTLHSDMSMSMHMLELMYAPSDRLTLMAMVPYMQMEMKHLTRTGERFPTQAEGFGDVRLMAMKTLLGDVRKGENRLIFNAGISLPSGSTEVRDDTPHMKGQLLEYPMQLGSGTVDLMPGLTYLGESKRWGWGAQAIATARLGTNDRGYRFGHEGRLSAWGSYQVTDWFAPSIRLAGLVRGNVHGSDPELNPLGNPESDPRQQGARSLDLFLGLNLYAPKGKLKGHRLTIEGGFPVYQHLSGPQLERDWEISVGWSYTFHK